MNEKSIIGAARWIVDQHSQKKNYANLPESFGIGGLDDAYLVQQEVVGFFQNQRGRIGGHKLALTSKPIQQLCGLDHPCAGQLFHSEIHYGKHDLQLDDFLSVGIEFELAVRIAQDMTSIQGPWNRENILPFIDQVYPAFELVLDRNADYQNLDILSVVADNAWSGGAVLGTECSEWQHHDFDRLPVEKIINGKKETSVTGQALGNPMNSVVWLANFLNQSGSLIRAGQILMTGSTFATHPAEKGDVIEYFIDQIGMVKIEIV